MRKQKREEEKETKRVKASDVQVREIKSKIESKSTAEGFRRQKSFAAAYSRPANDDDSRPVKAISGESLSFLFLG